MKHFQILWLLSLMILVASGLNVLANPITGRVIDIADEQPLADVSINISLSGVTRTLAQPLKENGAFSIKLNEMFSQEVLDTNVLYLQFSKTGYLTVTVQRRTKHRGVFEIRDLEIRLEGLSSTGSKPAGNQPGVADGLRRILHGSYALFGSSAESSINLNELNQRLPRHVRRGIITYLQRMNLPVQVALDKLPAEMQQADSLALNKYAKEMDALAVIKGEAELFIEDNKEFVEMASEYRIVPELANFHPGILYIDDVIPADRIRPSRLSGNLSKIWGGNTVFALALYETREAMKETDGQIKAARLNTAEQYLKAQKENLQGGDILKGQIEELISFIDRARRL